MSDQIGSNAATNQTLLGRAPNSQWPLCNVAIVMAMAVIHANWTILISLRQQTYCSSKTYDSLTYGNLATKKGINE